MVDDYKKEKEFRSMSVPSVDENYFDKIKIEILMLMLCCVMLLFSKRKLSVIELLYQS